MIALSTLSRAGAAAAPLLIAGILLAVPSNTHERSDAKAAAATRLAVAPAVAIDRAVPAAHRAAPARGHAAQAHAPLERPATAGMVVGIDPETGELGMPTPEQLKALSDSPQYEVDHSAAGLLEVHHADGSVSVDLQGRFQEYATVRVGPDGKLIFRCVDGEENAKRAVKSSAPAPTAPALEER
jgi:hypothetical protein